MVKKKEEFMNTDNTREKIILVTGATGYVAGRLIPMLLQAGYRVRAMGRSMEKMAGRPWATHANIERVQGDILDPASLERAVKGCGAVYYLVHSMISKKGRYRQADQVGAQNMVQAAAKANADHIIYLGGLGDVRHKKISKHLISRNEVGHILLNGPVPATVLRAAMILGSGSASFEILRYLAERLPIMITPKWVHMPTQPIAITNVLTYLTGCLEHPETHGKTFDIGGPDVVAYRDLFRIFAQVAALPPPVMIPVPVLSPRLSSLWIHLVTPVPAAIAQPLTEGLSLPTTCTENRIREIIPQPLLTCHEAIERALDRVRQERIDTCWADAGELIHPEWAHCGDSEYAGGTLMRCGYRAIVSGSPRQIWPAIAKLGGKTGYYAADLLWKIRGILDIFSGGVGLNRGRRSSDTLQVGDALDFWRVLELEPYQKLLLIAEMKTPGEALLEMTLKDLGDNRCEMVLLSKFLPKGLMGILYWYSLYPFHQYIFSHMLKGMAASTGQSLLTQPERFTPKISTSCTLAESP